MPRVNSLTKTKRIEDGIYKKILMAMAMESVKKKDIAEHLGLHKSTVSQHFNNHTFSFEQLLEIFEFLEMEISVCVKPV